MFKYHKHYSIHRRLVATESSFLYRSIISGWSSGTGGAGFFGAITYAILGALKIPPSISMFLLLVVPISMAIR